ncbi:MAG: ABC transporter permease, partial [Clostridia bacterium]
DNVTTNISGFICKGYTIVGIIKSEVSSIYSFKNSYSLSNYMKSDFFFTDVNVYNDGVGVLKPHLSDTDSVTERKYLAFDNLDNKDLLNEEYMMLGWNNRYSYNEDNQTIFKTNVYIESNSYKNFYKLYSGLKEYFNSVLGYEAYVLNVPNIFSCYEEMYTQANIISYIFSFVGIIIILCAIINLFSSIKHSVRERKFYLTMLRAIGARDRIIPKLYLVESAIIASRANLFIVGIGFAISAAIKMYIDSVMKNHYIGFDFSIPWFIIIICIVTVVIALYAISLLFAHICTSRLSKKPIVSILNKY